MKRHIGAITLLTAFVIWFVLLLLGPNLVTSDSDPDREMREHYRHVPSYRGQ